MTAKSRSGRSRPKSRSILSDEESRAFEDALTYHEYSSMDKSTYLPGKVEVIPTKRCSTQRDLSLAYSPGVAAPSLEIARDPSKVNLYTSRANLVAVVSNGTAVLGLGDIGPLAAKPVMEGKGVLFKKFANINVFDIELDAKDPDDVIRACQMLEPTVGGINLEDIKAPDCFYIEEKLKQTLSIPVFHDDQHGTAIIVAAAFLNGLVLSKKRADKVKVVFSGAGAAAIACANMLLECGVKRDHVILCDQEGTVHSGRKKLDPYKARFAHKMKERTLKEVLKDADVFVGLSVGGVVNGGMIKPMAKNPMIFALANPYPEIGYAEAKAVRPDAIVATGRTDFPNQVNNVLGFPSIFRGALDVEASAITESMKMAAAQALAALAREDVPDSVSQVYGGQQFVFGSDYIIPKPFDPRVLLWVAPAVAQAAIRSKVARKKISLTEYRERLANQMDRSRQVMNIAISKARKRLTRVVFPEGDLPKILKAAYTLLQEGIAVPVLLGNPKDIETQARTLKLDLKGVEIVDPRTDKRQATFAQKFYSMRRRKGLLIREAGALMEHRTYFGLMLLETGAADAMVSGLSKSYPETIRPALQIIRMKDQFRYAAGVYIMMFRERIIFFADTTVNIDPNPEQLAEIASQTADKAQFFNIQPRIAFLSFSNFGSAPHPLNDKIQKALEILRKSRPELIADGELQADTAVTEELLKEYPFSHLKEPANILIFPNLASGNIAYKLMQRLGNADVIGPILMGPRKPVHVLQQGASVEEIVRMSAIAAAEANVEHDTSSRSSARTPSRTQKVRASAKKKR